MCSFYLGYPKAFFPSQIPLILPKYVLVLVILGQFFWTRSMLFQYVIFFFFLKKNVLIILVSVYCWLALVFFFGSAYYTR